MALCREGPLKYKSTERCVVRAFTMDTLTTPFVTFLFVQLETEILSNFNRRAYMLPRGVKARGSWRPSLHSAYREHRGSARVSWRPFRCGSDKGWIASPVGRRRRAGCTHVGGCHSCSWVSVHPRRDHTTAMLVSTGTGKPSLAVSLTVVSHFGLYPAG